MHRPHICMEPNELVTAYLASTASSKSEGNHRMSTHCNCPKFMLCPYTCLGWNMTLQPKGCKMKLAAGNTRMQDDISRGSKTVRNVSHMYAASTISLLNVLKTTCMAPVHLSTSVRKQRGKMTLVEQDYTSYWSNMWQGPSPLFES